MENRRELEHSIDYARKLVSTIQECEQCKTVATLTIQVNNLLAENTSLLETNSALLAENKELFARLKELTKE